jgi:hypothetical protein
VGFALQEGLLQLDEALLSFFPEYDSLVTDEHCRAIRLRDLLTMRTGHETDTTGSIIRAPNWAEAFFKLPVKFKPGTHFVYNSGATYMLSAVVQRRAGLTVLEYLKSRLFEPLAFGPVFWDSSPQGVNTGGWGFMVTLEDIVKLGLLYLNRGTWQGRQILSESWVADASFPHADNAITPGASADWTRGYGYQFWRSRYGFRGDGAFGQYCLILPEFDAVLALSSETENMQEPLDIIWKYLPPACGAVKGTAEAEEQGTRLFNIAENPWGVDQVCLDFLPDRLVLSFKTGSALQKLQAGRFGWLESETTLPFEGYSFIPRCAMAGKAVKVSATFFRQDRGDLELRIVYLTSPHRETLSLKFEGDSLLLRCPANAAARALGKPDFEIRGLLA